MKMRRRFIAVLLAAGCAFAVAQGEGSKRETSNNEREVRKLLDELRQAQMRHDLATLNRIYADDYTLTEDDGTLFKKQQRIAALGKLKFASSDVTNVRVRIYNGDAAVVNYTATVRFRVQPTGPFTFQVTSVAVRTRGRWQLVAGHESFIRP